MSNIKQSLSQGFVYRVIKFNAEDWLKLYNGMNLELRCNVKIDFENIFLRWWLIQFVEKLWEMWENIEISSL